MIYRVLRVHEVDAPDAQRAIQISHTLEPDQVVVRASLLPEQRYAGYEDMYVQPLDVLDRAWDGYLDATMINELDATRIPQLTPLMNAGVAPQQLSLLFDLAITAAVEPPL